MKKILLSLRGTLFELTRFHVSNMFLCTFSGGQDSILTLIIFLHFQYESILNIQTLYCHHFIQLKNFFCFWQVTRISFLFETPSSMVLATDSLKGENKARNWRQISFERMTHLQQCSILVLGHTASDKLETVLSNLKRGTSSQGLAALKSITNYSTISNLTFFPSNLIRKNSKNKNLQVRNKKFLKKNSFKKNFAQILMKKWPTVLQILKVCLVKNVRWRVLDYEKSCSEFQYFVHISPITVDDLLFYRKRVKPSVEFPESKQLNAKLTFQFLISIKFTYSLYSSQVNGSFLISRPILSLHRNDVTKICRIYKFPIVSDDTNELTTISRNHLRHELFPIVRYFFSLKIDLFSSRCLNVFILEQEYIQNLLVNSFQKLREKLLSKKQLRGRLKKASPLNNPSCDRTRVLTRNISRANKIKIRQLFQSFPVSLQRICLRILFIDCTKSQLNYSQIEFLRLVIQKN